MVLALDLHQADRAGFGVVLEDAAGGVEDGGGADLRGTVQHCGDVDPTHAQALAHDVGLGQVVAEAHLEGMGRRHHRPGRVFALQRVRDQWMASIGVRPSAMRQALTPCGPSAT
jgi:hypothetical protein